MTVVLTALLVGLMNLASVAVVRWWMQRAVSQPPTSVAVIAAVLAAGQQLGLAPEQLVPHADLVRTGKLYELLHHAALTLGKDHELRTVQDVIDWLTEAPSV